MKNNISILDCTLRDGGYINDWKFGYQNIRSILSKLTKAQIDIVECGFLEDVIDTQDVNNEYNGEYSFFNDVDQIGAILPKEKGTTQYVAMARYGLLDINKLKPYDGKSINGIRVTFHIDEVEEAIEFCKQIKEKGYNVYVQPVGTTSYTDSYLLELIDIVNNIDPFAFYIVDTLGLMRSDDLLRMFYLIDNNLKEDILLGFHSHNNLQLSFSNAQELANLHTKRSIIVDSSVYGMGRGAGNLNTELITQHLNSVKGSNYNTDYVLEIIDETINPLLGKYEWGYAIPYYLAAINNCHPNYATYLMNRKTLPVKAISNILNMITQDRRELYDKSYIAELYTQYQKLNIDDSEDLQSLIDEFSNKKVVIIAPGSSTKRELSKINKHLQNNDDIKISINFDGDGIETDYCFFSNHRRFQMFRDSQVNGHRKDTIITSNIKTTEDYYKYKLNYSEYLNSQPLVNDNATLMLLSILIKIGVTEVDIIGFDGFKINSERHYVEDGMETDLDENVLNEMNHQISEVVKELGQKLKLNFVTESMYQ